MVYKMTVENFVRIVCTVFATIKKVKKWLVFDYFWVNFVRVVRTVFEKFEFFMEGWEKKTNKTTRLHK